MKKTLLVVISVITTVMCYAQANIKGTITSAMDQSPIENAHIYSLKHTGKAITDSSGNFTLPCQNGDSIRISAHGYVDKYISVARCDQHLNIVMMPFSAVLDEFRMIGFEISQEPMFTKVDIKKADLNLGRGLYLYDAVNTKIPGVYMQRRTISGGQQFNIRGYGNGTRGTKGVSSNFDGQGYKVYLNGIPVTDAEGVSVMDDIDFNSLDRVSVIKGPSGVQYGMSIAGVINLGMEPTFGEGTSVTQAFQMGRYGTYRSTTQLNMGTDSFALKLNYGRQHTDGYMPHSRSNKSFVNLVSDHQLGNGHMLSTYFGYANSKDDRNGEATIDQYAAMDYSGNPKYIKNNAHSSVETFRAGIRHVYRINDHWNTDASVFGSARSINNSSAGGWNDRSPLDAGFRGVLGYRNEFDNHLVISGSTGLEAQTQQDLRIGYSMGTDSTNPDGYNVIKSIKGIQAIHSTTSTLFTQWKVRTAKKWTAKVGVGYSTMNIKMEDRLWSLSNNSPGNTYPATFEATYNNMVSTEAAILKSFRNHNFRARYSTSYKAPTASYFYIPVTGEVNKGLKPEKGTQFEIGANGSFFGKSLHYDVSVFQAMFTNKMTTVTRQDPENTVTLYSYIVNAGSLNNKGVELSLDFDIVKDGKSWVKDWNVFTNGAFSLFKYEDFGFEKVVTGGSGQDSSVRYDYSGNTVAGVPPVVANAGTSILTKWGFYLNLTSNYRGAMYFTSDEAHQTDPYMILNTRVGYKKSFSKFDVDLFAGANNATGQHYYYMVFVNQLPDAYIPAPKDAVWFGGFSVKYKI